MKRLKFLIQNFWPSLRGVLRKRCWRFAVERGRYMLLRTFRPITVEGFRIEHGGHMVGFWYFEVEGGLFKRWPSMMPEAPVIVDVGANSGVFGWCCRKRWPKARIIAVEPHPQLASECRMRRFGELPVYDKVYDVALSDRACVKKLYVTKDGGFTASLRLGFYGEAKLEELEIRCVTGDSVGFPNADLVKIDVDGAEQEVIRGGREFLARARFLVIEIEPGGMEAVQEMTGRYRYSQVAAHDFLFYPKPSGPSAKPS